MNFIKFSFVLFFIIISSFKFNIGDYVVYDEFDVYFKMKVIDRAYIVNHKFVKEKYYLCKIKRDNLSFEKWFVESDIKKDSIK